MQLTLDREIEDLVATEVREGHFASPEALLGTAVRHFQIARKYGEAEANKLSILREELRQADSQIDAGEYTEYGIDELPSLADATEREALKLLKRSSSKT
jgi:hypothetical protein